VVHCLTGKGRTAALTACILTWIGEFSSPIEALQYVSDRKCIPVDYLTIPSQRRYVQYFSNMLDGVKPRSEPLLLRRIILNTIPVFGDNTEEGLGCCPYLQLFKCGRLIGTAAPTVQSDAPTSEGSNAVGSGSNSKRMQLKWIKSTEGSISLSVDVALQGDILLRFRHADPNGARVSMFRAAFHTGYVPCGVLRLTKAQLDGACSDARFDDEFFIDLIFAPVEKALPGTVSQPTDSGLQVDSTTADKYEITLHKDTRFWDAVAARKAKSKKRRSRKFVATSQDQFSIADDIYIDKEEYAGTKVYFNSNEVSSKKGAATTNSSNDDLILQLARAEENPDSAESPVRNGNDDINLNSAANIELQALAELEKELGLEFLNTKSTSSTEKSNEKNDVNENFDKDNEEYHISNTDAKGNSYDDLDELEKYLESLNK
jgi:tensin